MIEVNNVIYRNIQQQVQANKEAIEAFSTVQFTLNNMGIKILGRVDNISEIPTTTYAFGDAFLVGTEEPYDIYIYTRNLDPDVHGTFINMGKLTVKGDQGEKGDKGDPGLNGYAPVVRYGTGAPITETTDKNGYLYMNSDNGNIYTYNDGWQLITSLKGDRGEKGNPGSTGSVGTTLSIVGRKNSPSELPTDFSSGLIPKNSAYLVNVDGSNHLYIILGDQAQYSTWQWYDTGDFNLGSVIYKNGVFQYSADITDEYSTNTGAVVTDTATSAMYDDLMTDIADKVSSTEMATALSGKQDSATALKLLSDAPSQEQLVSITTDNTQATHGLSSVMGNSSTKVPTCEAVYNWADDRYIAKNPSTGFQTISASQSGGESLGINNSSTASHTWLRFQSQGTNTGEFGVKADDGTPRYYNNKQGKGYTMCLDAGSYASPTTGTNSYIKLGQWVILFGRCGSYQSGGGTRTYVASFPVTMADSNYFVMMTNDCDTSDIGSYSTSGNYGCYNRTVNGCTFKVNYSASYSRGVDYIIIGRTAASV